MNFKYYLRKLQESSDYRKFMKENPEAFLSSGFFSIDKDGNGPVTKEEADAIVCWCGAPDCVLFKEK